MKPVFITTEKYGQYGNVVKLSNGIIEMLVTIDVGPRIIRFGFVGKDNILFEDTQDLISRETKDMDVFGEGSVWHIYGGHRLWSSPEISPRTYYPDNEPVEYEELKNGVRFTPPVQKWTNLQMVMDIVFKSDKKMVVKHRIINKGAWDIELAPWALTVCKAGGVEYIPFPKRQPELLPNRNIGVWSYTNLQDERIHLGKEFMSLKADPNVKGKVKLGLNNEEGYALYFIDGDLFAISYDTVADGCYPDGGMSYETYTKGSMLEMETLGELELLGPDDSVELEEKWQLFDSIPLPENEKQLKELVSKKLKK
ncbi:MAG: hypothetical protein PHE51_09930 [Eubacteriales bacterium]|nr:hypothetical protein [Eubacteriales bacterium]